jgi:hypothetical protein
MCTQDAEQIRTAEHPRARNRVWLPCARISARLHEHAYDLVLTLEHGARDRRLPTIVQPIRISPTLQEAAYKLGMAAIRREHQKRIAFGTKRGV